MNILNNAWIRSKHLSLSTLNQRPNDFEPAMLRHPVTAIAHTGSLSRCDAVPMAQGRGSKLANSFAPVAYAHDFGRESDDNNLSGEGPG